MLQIQNLSKSYDAHTLFENVNLQMNAGERLGLVGRNGHGKSTLFKLILKQEEWDSGEIHLGKNYQVGHLAQHLVFTEYTILSEACLGLPPDECDDHYKAEAILFGLGFDKDDLYSPPSSFSGGFQIRLNLAKVLLSKPNLLLLDEPTNYLDIVSIRWLIKYLCAWPNEMIIISHDRDFMDQVTTHTAAIHRLNLKRVAGPTAKLYEQIILEEEVHEKTRQNDDKKRKEMDVFINRFRAKANKASVVQSRIKMRDKLPSLEQLSNIESLDFDFRYQSFPAKVLMEIEDLSFGYEKDQMLFENLNLMIGKQDRIAIIGKNGKGKSTLLNVLAGELTPNSGTIKTHPQTTLGYFGQTNINRLDNKLTIEQEVQSANLTLTRTQVRSICGTMMFEGDKATKKIDVLSGGEKSRVLLGKILAHPSNLLFLDEPTNHLDMESIQALSSSIQDYEGAVVLVTHTEILLRELVTKLIVFHKGGVEIFDGSYDDFLEKIGWEEETKKKSKKKKKPAKENHQQNKERTKEQKKIQKQMHALESQITDLEAQLETSNASLLQASQKQDRDQIRSLSESISILQKQIDENFEALANLETNSKT